MSNEITKKDESVFELIAQVQKNSEDKLPSHLKMSRFMDAFNNQFRLNQKLLSCSKASVISALKQCICLGLEVGPLAHAYLIPYKNECQLSISYKGLIDLAMRSGKIKSISARIVNEGDVFEFEHGSNEYIKHVPKLTNRGKLIAVYAIAQFMDGTSRFEIMSVDEIELNRSKSMSGSSGPWKDFYDEMAKKCVIRRLFKYLQISVDMQVAIGVDEMTESKTIAKVENLHEETETERLYKASQDNKIQKIEEMTITTKDIPFED